MEDVVVVLFVHMMLIQMPLYAHVKLVTQAQVLDHRLSVQVKRMHYSILHISFN